MLAFWKKNKTTAAGMLGLAPTADGLALARLHWQAGVPRLQSCAFLAASADAQPGALQQYVEREGLAGLSVNLLAASNDYQMLLVERPEVADSELRDAVRWRIRELVSQPVDGLVVDAFALPADAFRGRTPMVYCAALARTRMNELAALCESAGLRLASIDVAELALRNLGLLAGAEGQNLATLQLGSRDSLVCVQNGADLYMARRIERGLDNRGEDSGLLALEIQRSLDYFESQMGKGHLGRLLLLPPELGGELVQMELSSRLSQRVQLLDLATLFADSPLLDLAPPHQARCLPAIGAALRREAL